MVDGPWFIYDHYLTVKEWTPDFHPENDSIVNVAVWIRISGLPVEYYNPKVLQVIGNLVGRTVKVDKNMLQSERGKYARICVEVDISKPLLAMFELKDKSYRVEFEGLHLLCILYGKFGHYKEGCSLMKNGEGLILSVNEQSHGVGTTSNGKKGAIDEKGQEDGPWQVVQKQRRIRKMPESKKKVPATGSWLAKARSRFQALGNDMGETSGVVKESNNGRELNKENVDGIKSNDRNTVEVFMETERNNDAIINTVNGHDETMIMQDSIVSVTNILGEGSQGKKDDVEEGQLLVKYKSNTNKGERKGKQMDNKGTNKKGSRLGTRGNMGFKDKNEGPRKRNIETVLGKKPHAEILSNKHVNIQRESSGKQLIEDGGVTILEQLNGNNPFGRIDSLTQKINDLHGVHGNGDINITLNYAARPPDVSIKDKDNNETGAVDLNIPRDEGFISSEGEQARAIGCSMEEEIVQETPELC
ncbi:uncharacterized protein LOC131650277 [Vicia villosa]|uniref:uncharacterized protein LOC131650277 n=1 Tax=Vicia villosa TaxID=3911 RepID=UPI00273CB0DE|nr:uncharacterized protein LOC131650277 [Vicia villosa]